MRTACTRWIAGAAVGAALALVAGPAAAQLPSQVGDEISVGKNATGEACRLRLAVETKDALAFQRYALLCAGWTTPSGELSRWRVSREYTPERVVNESGWSKRVATRVVGCRDLEKTSVAGAPAVLRQCERGEGLGWPVVVAGVIVKGPRAYGLEALPTNVRVLERAAEILEGTRPPAQLEAKEGALSAAVRRAEAIVGASGKPIAVADVGLLLEAWFLGKRQFRGGNRAAAEDVFRRTLEISQRVLGVDHPTQGTILMELALCIASAGGRYDEAERLYARAEPLVQRSTDLDDAPRLLSYRSWTLQYQRRYMEAIPPAEAALRLVEGGPPSMRGLGHYQSTLAHAYEGAGRLDHAAIYADRAVALLDTRTGDPEWRAYQGIEARGLLARVAERQNRLPEARFHREEALKRAERMFGDAPLTARMLYALGTQDKSEGRLDAALASYRRGAEIQTRNRASRGRVRALDVEAYLDALFRASAAAPDQAAAHHAEAFVAAQIPRDTETAKALQAMVTRVAAGDPALSAVVRELQETLRQRDRFRGLLAEEDLKPAEQRLPAALAARLAQQFREADARVPALEQRLQAQFPRYAQFSLDPPVTAADLTAALRDDEALLFVLVTPQESFVFAARRTGVRAHRVRVPARALQGDVEAIRRSVDAAGGTLGAFDVAAAHRLYRQLVAPVVDTLSGAHHLIVAPSGPLLSLPPGLLVTAPPPAAAGDDYRGVAWLARDRAVSVVPSVRAFRDLRAIAAASAGPRPFIGFGDPAFSGPEAGRASLAAVYEACRQEAGVAPALVAGLSRLRESALELRLMARMLGATGGDSVVTGAEATEGRVRATDLAQYRVVAFATHGLLPGELRCQAEPALALTPPAAPTDRAADGVLDASEIAQLRLDADWVVLSACNTVDPAGKLGGESFSGLTQAFFYAGARTVLATHWAIASRAAVQLTTGTFAVHARERALGKAEALRRSQMAMAGARETSHPFFWAPFVLVGDGGPGR